jgi:hypothetical protein
MSEKQVVGWRIWYADGKCYSSAETDWAVLPDDGALIVMVYFSDDTKRIMSGGDYYWKWVTDDGEIAYGRSDAERPPDPARYPGVVAIRGKWASDVRFSAAEEAAHRSTWP